MSDDDDLDLSPRVPVAVTPDIMTSARVMTRLQCQCHQSIADGETVKVTNNSAFH